MGKTATANTTTPMPPSQTRKVRQTLMELGNWSKFERVVDPVVVRPDMVSKYASVKLRPGILSSKGMVAIPGSTIQVNAESKKPSLLRNSLPRDALRVKAHMAKPIMAVTSIPTTKLHTAWSSRYQETAVGNNIKPANIRMMSPKIFKTPATLCIIESPSSKKAGAHLKEFFNFLHRFDLGDEHD